MRYDLQVRPPAEFFDHTGAYGDVNYGQGYTGTERGNAETAKPWPKVARAVSLSRRFTMLVLLEP
jgi:hypothetical protein